jgi:hypothetical protein
VKGVINQDDLILIVKVGNPIVKINGKGVVMRTNLTRQKSKYVTDNHSYMVINYKEIYPPYYDDGYMGHYSKGWKTHRKRKVITHYQYRAFRTWKHNRKHQWKDKIKKM